MYKIGTISEDIGWSGQDKLIDLQRTYKTLMFRLSTLLDKAASERMVVQKILVEHDLKESIYRVIVYGDFVQMPADKE